MTTIELIDRLSALIEDQAEIIRLQAVALAQLGSVKGLDEKIRAAESERNEILGDT